MNKLKKTQALNRAKEMLINGETFDSVMNETGLRLKDLKKLQSDEISSHF